jgi:hypothetical protein
LDQDASYGKDSKKEAIKKGTQFWVPLSTFIFNPHFSVDIVTSTEMPINVGGIADFGTEM